MIRCLSALLICALALSACRVSADELGADLVPPAIDNSALMVDNSLPVIGPVPGSSHWHAAYVVRICDDVLPPFDSDADPLGIHSHGDGVMHVHPFFEDSGYESALLGHFADAMDFELRDGEITLPSGETWRDGDMCGDRPGRVFVDRWRNPDPESDVERIFDDLDEVRFLADGELYQIAFAPSDSFPVVPPSTPALSELSNLVTPSDPWVDPGSGATADQVRFWPVAGVADQPCVDGAVPERVLFGPARCFVEAAGAVSATDAVIDARAVTFNRQPAVEVRMNEPLIGLIQDHFGQSDDPLVFAIEIDGTVITAPQLIRPPLGDRLIISGGFSVESAQTLATVLASD